MKHANIRVPLLTMGIFFFFLILFAFLNVHDHKFNFSNYQTLNTGWSSGSILIEKLPYDFDTPKNEFIGISKALPQDFAKPQTIIIRSSLQDLIVKLDGVIIYEHIHEQIGIMNSYASLYHMIEIPADSVGLTIEILSSSPYQSMSGRMNSIVYGTTAEINYYLVTTFGLRFFVGLIVVFVGILLVIINMVAFGKISESSSLMGMVAFFLGLWILAESRILQFFIGQSLVIGSLAYLSLAFIPIAISYYIKQYVLLERKKLMNVFVITYVINSIFVIIAHTTGLLDFFESVIITQILILVGIVIVIPLLWIHAKKQESKDMHQFVYLVLFIATIGILELGNFLLNNFDQTSIFAVVGIGVLMIYLLTTYIKDILNKIKQGYEKDIYQRLAYLDPLTKAKNRLAFNEKLENIFNNNEELANLGMIYFDLNELKKINDTEGHLEGDQALIEIYERIKYIYGSVGDIYRIGGDEFVFMSTSLEQYQFLDLNQSFDSYMETINKTNKYKLEISYGTTFYDLEKDKTPKDIITRADKAMYSNKKTSYRVTN